MAFGPAFGHNMASPLDFGHNMASLQDSGCNMASLQDYGHNMAFGLAVGHNKLIKLIMAFGHNKLIELIMAFGHNKLIELMIVFGHNKLIKLIMAFGHNKLVKLIMALGHNKLVKLIGCVGHTNCHVGHNSHSPNMGVDRDQAPLQSAASKLIVISCNSQISLHFSKDCDIFCEGVKAAMAKSNGPVGFGLIGHHKLNKLINGFSLLGKNSLHLKMQHIVSMSYI
jgi:hypothetical protein